MKPFYFANMFGNVWRITGETVEILTEDGEWSPSTLSACQILELENEKQLTEMIQHDMTYYKKAARAAFQRGTICIASMVLLGMLTVSAAIGGSAGWAVASAVAGVFAAFASTIHFDDYRRFSNKSSWRN